MEGYENGGTGIRLSCTMTPDLFFIIRLEIFPGEILAAIIPDRTNPRARDLVITGT